MNTLTFTIVTTFIAMAGVANANPTRLGDNVQLTRSGRLFYHDEDQGEVCVNKCDIRISFFDAVCGRFDSLIYGTKYTQYRKKVELSVEACDNIVKDGYIEVSPRHRHYFTLGEEINEAFFIIGDVNEQGDCVGGDLNGRTNVLRQALMDAKIYQHCVKY